MSDLNKIAQGKSESFAAQVRDAAGEPYGAYTGSEGLAGSVRIGRDFPALFAPTLAWISGPDGTIAVTIAGADTAGLDVGRYWLEIHLADDSADLYEGSIEVTYSPGTAVALVSYGTYQRMLDMAPGVAKFMRETDLAGFAQQQHDARMWFEDLIHRHHRGTGGFATDTSFGWSSYGGGIGSYGAVPHRDGRRSPELAGWLAADALVVTSAVVEAVTAYAVALLYDRQAATVKDGESFAAVARKFFGRAENAALGIVAELDTDADGITDYTVDLGTCDTREG